MSRQADQKNTGALVFIISQPSLIESSFLGYSLDCLVKSLCESDLKHLSQELDNKVLDLVEQKGFCPCE